MDFSIVPDLAHRKHADVLVLPFWSSKNSVQPAGNFTVSQLKVKAPIDLGDFKGKESDIVFVYGQEASDKRIVLLGLGDQSTITTEKLRRAFSSLAKACLSKKIKAINLLVPSIPALIEETIIRGIVEGLFLSNYVFIENKCDSIKEEAPVLIQKVAFIGAAKSALAIANKYAVICKGVHLARNLANGNADDITPQYLSQVAQKFAKELPHTKVSIFDKKKIQKEGMGLLLAVNRGSKRDPAFIIIEYKGAPKSTDTTVLVGKGITYDTGGLNLKTSNMETMRCDMAGAAAVLAAIQVAAQLKLKINVTAVIPSTENCIDANSYKPGDVYKSYAGKTVEIGNTDAEGRLVLADALAYAVKHLKPTRIIDFATLTAAVEIALGSEATGLLCNNDALAHSLMRAGSDSFERVWRLPLYEEYRDRLKSDVADIKNVGGRAGGCILGGIFLQEFVDKKIPWAHCDIAGSAYLSEARRYHPKNATGIGVRLIIEFLEHI